MRKKALSDDPKRGQAQQTPLAADDNTVPRPTPRPATPATPYSGGGVPPRPANDTIRDVHEGSNLWTPNQPIRPYGPPSVVEPRWFDYRTGRNLNFSERQRYFRQLRLTADTLGILRALIETRKDQLLKIPWVFQKKDDPDAEDPRID